MFEKIVPPAPVFRTSDSAREEIEAACLSRPMLARYRELGRSENGRLIYGAKIGYGPRSVTLIAGAHSDEPVGPETLRLLITGLLSRPEPFLRFFEKATFVIVPHINPDGEAQNQAWIRDWPDVTSYLKYAFRELPGRDLEFGFPDMRIENKLVAGFFRECAPVALHLSLHGMGFSDGVLLLIEKHWLDRTRKLQNSFRKYAAGRRLALHDHDRNGEKGFQYIGPGFTTTPEGAAMRDYFLAHGDSEMAAFFHNSSMEFVRAPGGDPLCLVTELPLFLMNKKVEKPQPGVPQVYLDWKSRLPHLRQKLMRGESIASELREFNVRPFELGSQIRFQLHILEQALKTVL